MIKQLLFLITCLCSLYSGPIQDLTIDPNALFELTRALGIPQGTDLLLETQKHWLRASNQERWEMAELSSEQKLCVLTYADKQGLLAPRKPALQTYDKALILGATTSSMQGRLEYLKELWLQGIRFKEVIFLTGDRPLDKRVDCLIDRCNNESEAAHILWKEADLPQAMKSLPTLFVATPMKIEGSSLKRPNTEDTIKTWLQLAKEPGLSLFISSQPYCGYQFAVLKTCLPQSISFDLVGQGAGSSFCCRHTRHSSALDIPRKPIKKPLRQVSFCSLL